MGFDLKKGDRHVFVNFGGENVRENALFADCMF